MPEEEKPRTEEEEKEVEEKKSLWERIKSTEPRLRNGYIALIVFMLVLSIALIVRPPIPIQTILIALAIIIMIIGQASIQDLLAGVILHPIMAMTAGFLIAGAMGLAGGFDVLLYLLDLLANLSIGGSTGVNLEGDGFPLLGYIGVAIILANIPTIMPMPCGRIIAAALIPGVYLFGDKIAEVFEVTELGRAIIISTMLAAFIVNAAASCGPSPLGGIGGIGEGNMGIEIGSSGKSQCAGIMIATGVCALVIAVIVQPIPG
jgi:hypothetical protein